MPERTRAFLAVLLPAELIAAAAAMQERLHPFFGSGDIRWVEPENFHLTVRFFGEIDRKALKKATEVVEGLDGGFSALTARLGSASAFPSPGRPQVLWVAIEDPSGRLEALAAEIDHRIRRAGFGAADRPWKSHLTLGRVRRGRKIRVDRDWARGLTGGKQSYTIGRIALMQSELRPQGPRYTALRTAIAEP
jgi:2'-5' RNA ligase